MTARARRSDARDNQALLLAAAKDVFAEDGPDAPLDRVARRGRRRQRDDVPALPEPA